MDEQYLGPIRRGMHGAGIPVEFSKGEAWYGQHEVNTRYADAVTSADRHTIYKNGRQGDRLPQRHLGDLHGEALREGHRQLVPHPLEPVPAATAERLRRRPRRDRRLPPLPRRDAEPHPRAGAVRRSVDQLLQALRDRELGADLDLVGARQPHLRLPHRRPRPVAPGRVPDPGRRRQPLPRLRGAARRRPRRDRERDRPGAGAQGQRLRGGRGGALPLDPARGGRPLGGAATSRSALRRGGLDALPQLRAHGAATFDEVVTDYERRRMFERG